jgi:hypothetical protein
MSGQTSRLQARGHIIQKHQANRALLAFTKQSKETMNKQNVTFTCRIDGTGQTEQRTATMGYCYATEIAYKDLSGQDISDFLTEAMPLIHDKRMPDIKKSIYAILSCMIAYYESAGKDSPVKDTDLMNEATPLEICTAFATFLKLRGDFYHLPAGEPEDKSPVSDDKATVPGASASGKRKGKAKN